jgi:hypothetical protein
LNTIKNLKSLQLISYELTDEHLDGIHLYLHQLKSFSCDGFFITDKTLHNLSKMQNLSKVCISSRKISDSGICDLIKKSPNIKTLYISNSFINKKTIEVFTERANNNPKIRYKFCNFDDSFYIPKTYSGISFNLLIRSIYQIC